MCDCVPCIQAVQKGRAWAIADNRKHARVHSMVFDAWDDGGGAWVTWMPAHCSGEQVGQKTKGYGRPLTLQDIRSSWMADVPSKVAAETHRVLGPIGDRWQDQSHLIQQAVQWIGMACHLASNMPKAPHRDVETSKEAALAAKLLKASTGTLKPPKASKKVRVRTAVAGGHSIVAIQTGKTYRWRCTTCCQSSKSWMKMAPQKRSGSVVAKWDATANHLIACGGHEARGHQTMTLGETLGCRACRAYGSVKA